MGHNVSFSRIVQLTLADYSLSNKVFDQVKHYKDTLKQLVTACNQTEALGALIPNLEEFIDVAQSEWLCSPQEMDLDLIHACVKIVVKFTSAYFQNLG